MIDDKKIETIAEKSFENKFTDCGEMVDEGDIKEAIALGIKLGINEFLRDLWHPTNEEPKEGFDLVYINKAKEFREISSYNSDRFDDLFGNGWEAACRRFGIYKWAYKDDLLLKEGGEQ